MGGVDMAMLQHISALANVSIVLPSRVATDYITDSKQIDGKWPGLIGDILYNKSDLALCAWCLTLDESLVVESTESYFTEEFTFFIPRAGMYPRYLSVTRVFASDVWLLVFMLTFIAAIMFRLVSVGLTTVECDMYKDFSTCLLSVWSVLLNVGVHKMPLSQPLRGLFFLWLTYSLAISTVFQTYVTTYIVDPGHRYQIDSVDEVMESGLEVYVADFLFELFGNDLLKHPKSWRKCGNAYQCLTTASASSGVVMLAGKVFAEYKSQELNCTFKYHKSSSDFIQCHMVMVLKKGSPYLERINSVIRRLVEGGYPGKFFKDVTREKRLRCSSELDQYVPMSLDQLQCAFVVMMVGMLLSLLLFFGELMIKLTRRNNRTRPKTIH
jgi:TM2 domain-containing membrane protein YozV